MKEWGEGGGGRWGRLKTSSFFSSMRMSSASPLAASAGALHARWKWSDELLEHGSGSPQSTGAGFTARSRERRVGVPPTAVRASPHGFLLASVGVVVAVAVALAPLPAGVALALPPLGVSLAALPGEVDPERCRTSRTSETTSETASGGAPSASGAQSTRDRESRSHCCRCDPREGSGRAALGGAGSGASSIGASPPPPGDGSASEAGAGRGGAGRATL